MQEWFRTKPTTKDRVTSAFMGFWAGIWLGIIFALIFNNPASIATLFWSASSGAVACSIIGSIFPKYPRVVFIPFCLFAIGG